MVAEHLRTDAADHLAGVRQFHLPEAQHLLELIRIFPSESSPGQAHVEIHDHPDAPLAGILGGPADLRFDRGIGHFLFRHAQAGGQPIVGGVPVDQVQVGAIALRLELPFVPEPAADHRRHPLGGAGGGGSRGFRHRHKEIGPGPPHHP